MDWSEEQGGIETEAPTSSLSRPSYVSSVGGAIYHGGKGWWEGGG